MFEFCSGLVDLVVCVGHHGGGGHRLTLAGKRFVGLVAENVAKLVRGMAEKGDPMCRESSACRRVRWGCSSMKW